jgi:carbon starvation protein CstA
MVVLWAITVYLAGAGKNYFVTLLPAMLMTAVTTTYILAAPEGFSLPSQISYAVGGAVTVLLTAVFFRLRPLAAARAPVTGI